MEPAKGKLGVMCVGLGAVTTTFMTCVLMTRKGLAKPVGSMTQYDIIRVGRGKDKKYLHYGEIVPLASLNDIVFGAWDVYPANAYESAVNALTFHREVRLHLSIALESQLSSLCIRFALTLHREVRLHLSIAF